MRHIVTKISLLSASLIIITVTSIISVFFISNSNTQLTESLKQYITLADLEGDRLNQKLDDLVHDLRFISDYQAVRHFAALLKNNLSESDETQQQLAYEAQQLFYHFIEHNPDYLQIRFIDANGMERVRVDRTDGQVTAVESNTLQDKSGHEYVSHTLAMKQGEVYFSDINLNREHGVVVRPHTPTLRIATPMIPNTGMKATGMIVINVAITPMLNHIQTVMADLGPHAFITNQNGSYLSHPDKHLEFGFDTGNDHRLQDTLPELDDFYSLMTEEQKLLYPSQNSAGLASAISKIFYDRSNPSHFIAVGIAAPRDMILAEEYALMRRGLLWAIAFTVMGVLISMAVARRISRPLLELTGAAQRFTEKREKMKPSPTGNDEVARLGHTLKGLTDEVLQQENRLKAFNTTLEQRVEERTRELNESEYMLSVVLNSLPNRISWKDVDGNYMGCNRAFAEDAGIALPEGIIGKNDSDMPWYEQAKQIRESDREVVEDAAPRQNIIEQSQRADGTPIWLETSKIPLFDGDGNISGTLCSQMDITERRQAEQVKKDFLSTISHELRTPLTSIRGSLGLILGGALQEQPEKITELLKVADINSERLLQLINELLDLQKLEAGKMKFNFSEVFPCSFLKEAISINAPFAKQHDVTLQLNQCPATCSSRIQGDLDRLLQVLTNLISNAVKFSPAGETVELVHRCLDGAVHFTVSDRGPGVPEEFREHLFDKFTQADSSSSRQMGGTGLGLNIVRLIIEEHGGTIDYEDNPGGGSRFSVAIPLSKDTP